MHHLRDTKNGLVSNRVVWLGWANRKSSSVLGGQSIFIELRGWYDMGGGSKYMATCNHVNVHHGGTLSRWLTVRWLGARVNHATYCHIDHGEMNIMVVSEYSIYTAISLYHVKWSHDTCIQSPAHECQVEGNCRGALRRMQLTKGLFKKWTNFAEKKVIRIEAGQYKELCGCRVVSWICDR